MSIRKPVAAGVATFGALLAFAFLSIPASASTTREFLTSFNLIAEPAALAVDLETGNVYAMDKVNERIDIFGPGGGPPVDGVPSQITGLAFDPPDSELPAGVAVDNSCYEHIPKLTGAACEEFDPAYGDVYVIDTGGNPQYIQRYHLNLSSNKYELNNQIQLHGPLSGVAVDSWGNVYYAAEGNVQGNSAVGPVGELSKKIEKSLNNGKEELKETFEEISLPQKAVLRPTYLAVDGRGDVYVGSYKELCGPSEGCVGVSKLSPEGNGVFSEVIFTGNVNGARRPVAVDRSKELVYVGDGDEIAEYDPSGELQLKFGSQEVQGGSLGSGTAAITASGIAVDSERELIYVANPRRGDVDVFGSVIGPPVIGTQQPAVASVGRTSALVKGSVDPDSGQAGAFYFEYVDDSEYLPTSGEAYRAGGRTGRTTLAGGHSVVSTPGVALSGLTPDTTYHYRLVVNNPAGTVYGPDEIFTTASATPPVAITGPVSDVTATSVTLAGVVAPHGLSTSYVFEVGTDTGYGGAQLFGNAGTGTGEVAVSADLKYLVPGVIYHYRLVARSFDGISYGADQVFTTPMLLSPIVQPASTALVSSPSVQFPSIVGAIIEPLKASKAKAEKHRSRKKDRARGRGHAKVRAHRRSQSGKR